MRLISLILAAVALMLFVPAVSAHGALALNEFDTYAISDFEGQEDSFPWEGFEIWDIYVGDGYSMVDDSPAVYFKGNFAGDGTLRPTGSSAWTLQFNFDVGNLSYERWISHNGAAVTTNFEELETQLADGNVFQVHAWVPIPAWEGQEVSNLVVLSSVDDNPRDIAPGGFFDPATGQEIPFAAPPTPVFPAMGEGRIVETVPLTGAAKFLAVEVVKEGNNFGFTVTNALAAQGQHLMLRIAEDKNWSVAGNPGAESIEGGSEFSFDLDITYVEGVIEPLRIDLTTDIGGLQSWYAYADESGVHVVDDVAMASTYNAEAQSKDTPALPILFVLGALLVVKRTPKDP
jgi:hypothetical protein